MTLHDARGTLISISHYCPTAASLLLTPTAPEIVRAPASLALDGDLEGLDARDALPPLLAPGMLTDVDGYSAWERRAVAMLARDDLTASRAIETIAAATQVLQSWTPGGVELRDAVQQEFDAVSPRDSTDDLEADERRVRLAVASVPRGLACPVVLEDYQRRWQLVSPWWGHVDRVVRTYLAARVFGNWIAYYGRGLHAIVEYLRICLSVLKMEAARRTTISSVSSRPWQTVLESVRNADLLLVHLSDTKDLARRLS
jgi:hypothetical protein